jgi:hypothetical protein
MADAGRVAYSGVDVAASRDEMMRRIWFILAAFLAVGTVAACVSSKSQASKPQTQFGSQVGAPTPSGVKCTRRLNPGAGVKRALTSASPGAVVCLNSGSWSAITLSRIAPASPGVTLAATPGQTVVVPGFTVTGSSTRNLTIEGFDITMPGNVRQSQGGNPNNGIQLLCGISGGVRIEHNTIEDQPNGDGIYAFANNCGPHTGSTQSGVAIEHNQIDHVGTGLEIDGGMAEEHNFVISQNVIGPDIQDGGYGHYIQIQGIAGLAIDNNAFEGPPDADYEHCAANASHLNVLHVDTGGQRNVTFDNNIIWHSRSCGDTVLIQDSPMDNITIKNNLDVEDPTCKTSGCDANPVLVQAPHGLKFEHNTFVDATRGIALGGTSGTTYSDPHNMTAEDNIATPVIAGDRDYSLWKCSSSCTAQDNVSADRSAKTVLRGTGNVVKWRPSWATASWMPVSGPGYEPPPPGYYKPTGLALPGAGYQGRIGP